VIASTATQKGLEINAARDEGRYEKGKAPAAEELGSKRLFSTDSHAEWNYSMHPQPA
jgi:histidinol phosphatase-like PHP family hydrolase